MENNPTKTPVKSHVLNQVNFVQQYTVITERGFKEVRDKTAPMNNSRVKYLFELYGHRKEPLFPFHNPSSIRIRFE